MSVSNEPRNITSHIARLASRLTYKRWALQGYSPVRIYFGWDWLAALLKTILSRLREYVSNPDPMAKAAGAVAVVVAGNQPFYPL